VGETECTWYCTHYWPVLPGPDDRRLWSNWWNDDWQRKPDPGSNRGTRGGKPATNRTSYDAAVIYSKVHFTNWNISLLESMSRKPHTVLKQRKKNNWVMWSAFHSDSAVKPHITETSLGTKKQKTRTFQFEPTLTVGTYIWRSSYTITWIAATRTSEEYNSELMLVVACRCGDFWCLWPHHPSAGRTMQYTSNWAIFQSDEPEWTRTCITAGPAEARFRVWKEEHGREQRSRDTSASSLRSPVILMKFFWVFTETFVTIIHSLY
jgi:hypothetical protein